MFKYYFERVQDVAVGPVISLIIFFVFFIGLLIYVFIVNKKYIRRMKHLPMDEEGLAANDPIDNSNLTKHQ